MTVRIDALATTGTPAVDHSIPAMKDGVTVRLTVAQIIALANLGAKADATLANTTGPRGKTTPDLGTGNLNTFVENGFAFYSPSAPNSPSSADYLLVQYAGDANYGIQRAFLYRADSATDAKAFKRSFDSGAWGAWFRVRENEGELDARYLLRTENAVRNRVLNPAMQISQERGITQVSSAPSGTYLVDGVALIHLTSAGVFTVGQTVNATPSGSPYRASVAVTTADASIAAGEYAFFQIPLEGYEVADLALGSAAARSFTVRLGFKPAVAGTYGISFRNASLNRSYVTSITVAPGEVGTDILRTVTVPGDTAGTWDKVNGIGLLVNVVLACGTTQQTATLNAWQAGNLLAPTTQVNGIGATGTFELFDVGLYAGSSIPTFEVPNYADELRRCKRQAQWLPAWNGSVWENNGSLVALSGSFPVEMRATPTPGFVTGANMLQRPGAAVLTVSSINTSTLSVTGGLINVQLSVSTTLSMPVQANGGGNFIFLNARL